MKLNWNKEYFTIAVYASGAIAASAAVILLLINLDEIWVRIAAFGTIITPVIIGIFCAYLLNPLMVLIEGRIFGGMANSEDKKKRGQARGFSLMLTMTAVVMALTLMVVMVIPQLISNIVSILSNMDEYIETIKNFLNKIFEDNPTLLEFLGNPLDDFGKFISNIWKQYSNELLGFAGNIASGIWKILDTMKNVLIGLIISIYLLAKKEMFIGQTRKLIFAFINMESAQRLFHVCREASKKFLGSIVGKIIEALIVACICFIGFTVMGMPYSLLMSVIMFVFNLIPFIGPFIGAIPCLLLLLLSDSPIKALWFLIFLLILQNIDGNIIAPWVLGDSTGLPAVWILIAIIAGGGLFGILGMFLGVPVFAVIYMLLKDYIERRLKKRNLPRKTESYSGDVSYIKEGYVCEEEDEEEDEEIHKQPIKEIIGAKLKEYKSKIRRKK